MCRKELSEGAKACALKTRFYFDDMRAAARIAAELLPCGKMLLLSDEGESHAALAVPGAFAGLRVFCVVFGAEDNARGLFSLPDDVRLAVAVGSRSVAAARFFCTLRGAYLVALPSSVHAEGLLCAANAEGYPVNEPDAVLFDEAFIGGRGLAGSASAAFLSALYAEDTDIDAVFSGGRKEYGCSLLRLSEKLTESGGAASLFAACALQEMALRAFSQYPSRAFYDLLRAKGGRSDGECAFAAVFYSLARYAALFRGGSPRPYFVPDYAARAKEAAKYIGEDAFRNVNVPSAEECFARAQIFSECREHFRTAADVALCRAEKMKERYYRAGGKKPVFRTGALEEAYSLSAELSPMLSVAALERDFGLLPHMRGGTYGVKTGANV